MRIVAAYSDEHLPSPEPEDNGAGAVRYHVGGWYVDAINGEPSPQQVAAFVNPPVLPSMPILACLANLTIDGGDVAGVEDGATGLAFAFAVAPDVFWLFFTDESPNALYTPNAVSSSGTANVTARDVGYFEITVTGATEPYTLFAQVFRTI